MEDFTFWFGFAANVITVLAGIIAVAGVFWAVRGRARLATTATLEGAPTSPELRLSLSSTGYSTLQDIEVSAATLDVRGFSMVGDGIARRSHMNRGESMNVEVYSAPVVTFEKGKRSGGQPGFAPAARLGIEGGGGATVTVGWRSPIFPWRRLSRTYVWGPTRRYAGELPLIYSGKREVAFLKAAQDTRRNPNSAQFVAAEATPRKAQRLTDQTFEGVLDAHGGTALVGFGPTWQGDWWLDVRRMLDAFAASHSPATLVGFVDADTNPELTERFGLDTFPTFRLLQGGQVTASLDGIGSWSDLRDAFEPHMKRSSRTRRLLSWWSRPESR